MFMRNTKRENKLYSLWLSGYTIDEASYTTGIPRSSVGYYYKKFKKIYGDRSRPIRTKIHYNTASKPKTEFEKAMWTLASMEMMSRFRKMWEQGKYREIIEMGEAIFSMKRVTDYIENQLKEDQLGEDEKRSTLDALREIYDKQFGKIEFQKRIPKTKLDKYVK